MAQGQTNKKRKKLRGLRKFGFRARMATVGGRRVIANRRAKGRAKLSVKSGDMGTGKTKALKSRRRR